MRPLAIDDIREYFAHSALEREPNTEEIEAISRVTRGIPLAVKEAADIWNAGASLEEITGDTGDAYAGSQIVKRMTDRYMQHVVAESDKQALYALALAEGYVDILRAMLQPEDGSAFELEDLLQRLERDYASVHADHAKLHDHPAIFFQDFLQADVRRTSERVRKLNRRAVAVLRQRLADIEKELPRIEDRCQDDNWSKTTLDLTHYLYWVNETEALHWAIPRYLEGMAYNRALVNSLIAVMERWKHLSDGGERLLHVLEPGLENADALIQVLAGKVLRNARRFWP